MNLNDTKARGMKRCKKCSIYDTLVGGHSIRYMVNVFRLRDPLIKRIADRKFFGVRL